ncbi:MAG: RimJ/RimL family protein N-acetyltransferase [Paracoccaceae bacterium]|jgi:RimJ/RimL family protein N-acetyltransferase
MTAFNIPTLETERLILRGPKPADFRAIANFFGSDRSRFVGGPKPIGGAWQFLTMMTGHWQMRQFGMWVITENHDDTGLGDTGLGLVGFYYPVGWPEREIGWHIWSEETEGKGYAFEAAQAALDHAKTVLNWTTLVSYIAPDNARSIALAERLGATPDTAANLPETGDCACYRHPMGEAA